MTDFLPPTDYENLLGQTVHLHPRPYERGRPQGETESYGIVLGDLFGELANAQVPFTVIFEKWITDDRRQSKRLLTVEVIKEDNPHRITANENFFVVKVVPQMSEPRPTFAPLTIKPPHP